MKNLARILYVDSSAYGLRMTAIDNPVFRGETPRNIDIDLTSNLLHTIILYICWLIKEKAVVKYPVVVNKSQYGYDVHCPVLPGCHSQGDTLEDALENIKDAISTYMEMIADETKNAQVYEVEIAA